MRMRHGDADNRRKHTNDKRTSMHDAFMADWHQSYAHRFPYISCRSVCTGIPIHLLSTHQTYSRSICTRIPCRSSHCLNKFRVRKWTCEVWCLQFPQENQFHNLPRAGNIHLTLQADLETPRNCEVSKSKMFIITLTTASSSPFLVVAQFGPG